MALLMPDKYCGNASHVGKQVLLGIGWPCSKTCSRLAAASCGL